MRTNRQVCLSSSCYRMSIGRRTDPNRSAFPAGALTRPVAAHVAAADPRDPNSHPCCDRRPRRSRRVGPALTRSEGARVADRHRQAAEASARSRPRSSASSTPPTGCSTTKASARSASTGSSPRRASPRRRSTSTTARRTGSSSSTSPTVTCRSPSSSTIGRPVHRRPAGRCCAARRGADRAAISAPGFRGCPFLNAAAEFTDATHPVRRAVEDHREWFHDDHSSRCCASRPPAARRRRRRPDARPRRRDDAAATPATRSPRAPRCRGCTTASSTPRARARPRNLAAPERRRQGFSRNRGVRRVRR